MNWKRYVAGLGALLFAASAVAQTNYALFQFAIFYNSLLEFTWCPPMTVNGRVHANGDIYTGSAWQLTFNGLVTKSGTISSPAWDGHATSDYSVATKFNAGYSTNSLTLPISTNSSHAILDLPPNGEDPNSALGQQRYYNKAGLVLLVSNATVTLTLQNTALDPQPTNITAWYYPTNSSPTNYVQVTTNFPFLSITNTIYDQRENDTVKLTDIDVGILGKWLITNKTATAKFPSTGGVYAMGNVPNILYAADNRTYTNGQLTAVRLKNGTMLPTNIVPMIFLSDCGTSLVNHASGLTVATPNPLYVWGMYNCPNPAYQGTTNTTQTLPASLVSDALTILSGAWVDSQSATTLGSSKNKATSTTVNAAILTGIVPSTGSGSTQFSGGVQNLPRLLEDWGSGGAVTLTLNTSLVNLFNSARATNQFEQPGNYYQAPTRQFSFDGDFVNAMHLPPGTPMLGPLAPAILIQPQSQTVSAGQTAVFDVSAAGYQALAYQWRFNGTNVANATNSVLFITNASAVNAGFYSVVVTNAFGTQASSNGTLTVIYPPVIYSQPVSQAALPGSNVTFSVSAGGTAPLGYQWTFNGSAIAGGTNTSLLVSGVQSNATGSYSVVVTNLAGSVTSSPANLFLANAPEFLWARSASNGAPAGYSAADGVAVDGSGNVFVAGKFAITPTLDFGGGVLTNSSWAGGSFASFICEYNRAGSLVWVRAAGTNSGYAWPLRVGTDASGNAYLAGRFAGTGTFGTNSLVSTTPADLFVAKYDPQGQVLWVRQIGAYTNAPASPYFGFAVDLDGNAFVASRDGGSANLGVVTLTNSTAFLAKYDNAGSLVWAREALGADAIALGTNGAVCLTGYPGVLAKYDNLGTLVWSNSFPVGQAITLDAQENIFTTGYGAGTYDGLTLTNSGGGPDFFAAKCDPSGHLQWLRQVGGVQAQRGSAIGLDEFSNVYVTSFSALARPELTLSFGTTVLTNVFTFAAKYDPAGNPLWARAIATTNRAAARALAAKDSADVYVGGCFSGTASIGAFTLLNAYPCGGSSFSDPCSVEMFAAKLDGMEPTGLPVITAGPQDQAVMAGSDATFSVTAPSGIPLSYQWSLNGTNLAGATDATLSLTNVTTDQAGTYGVTVTNLAGIANASATLSVYPSAAAVLTAPPCLTGDGFQLTITGVPGFNYAVEASTNLVDWAPLVTNSSPFTFVDCDATNFPARYYRSVCLP